MLVLNKSTGISRKSVSKDLVVSNYGSSKYDHIKKATEQLMRQQHSDKTELEIAVCKASTLEQEKSEQVEISAKLLESKVKLEALSQAGKTQYTTLRFDCVASQTMSTHVQDFISKIEKSMKFIKDEVAARKSADDQNRRDWEYCERELEQEKTSLRTLRVSVESLTNDKHQLLLKSQEHQNLIQDMTAKLESCTLDCEKWKHTAEESTARVVILTKESTEALAQEARLNQQLQEKSTELGELQRGLGQLESDKAQAVSEKEALIVEVKSLLDQIEVTNKKFQESLKNSGVELDRVRGELAQTRTDLEQSQQHTSDLEAKLQHHQQLVDKFQLSVNTASESNLALEQVNSSIQAQLSVKAQEVEELVAAHEKLLQETTLKFETEIRKLQKDLVMSSRAQSEALKEKEDALQAVTSANAAAQEREELLKNEIAAMQKVSQERMSTNEQNAVIAQMKASVQAASKEVDTVTRIAEEKLKKKQDELSNVRAGYQAEVRKLDEKYKQQLADSAEREAGAMKAKSEAEAELENLKAERQTQSQATKGDKPDGRSEKRKATETEATDKSEAQKDTSEKRVNKKQDFLIKAKDVPASQEPVRTRSSDNISASQEESSSQGQRKRKATTTKPVAPASPVKKVHFAEPKKAYSRPRKAPVKTKTKGDIYEDIYTFIG